MSESVNFEQAARELARALCAVKDDVDNEQGVCQSMALRLFEFWGYDWRNPSEVRPQVRVTGNDEPDYLIEMDDKPVIMVEVKKVGVDLSKHVPQLKRYFQMVPAVKFAALFNGLDLSFFGEAGANDMCAEPFHELNFCDLAEGGSGNAHDMRALALFVRSAFDEATASSAAAALASVRAANEVLAGNLPPVGKVESVDSNRADSNRMTQRAAALRVLRDNRPKGMKAEEIYRHACDSGYLAESGTPDVVIRSIRGALSRLASDEGLAVNSDGGWRAASAAETESFLAARGKE